MTGLGVVLITGASRGLGQLMARRLAERGYRVFGTSRTPVTAMADGLRLLPLDVRDDQSVNQCVASVLAEAGRLDVLINNAGYGLVGALEECQLEQARALFETNFFGLHRMVQAVLPHLRQQRGGRIINIGSAASLAPVPFMGLYAASKAAVASYSAALRLELLPLGIAVSLVLPGTHRTDFVQHSATAAAHLPDYDHQRQGFEGLRRRVYRATPDDVARCIVEVVTARQPRAHYYVGADAQAAAVARRLLPAAAIEGLMRRGLDLGRRT